MDFRTWVLCSRCQQPIIPGEEGSGLVCFKVPGNEGYQFFHNRFCYGGCWEHYLSECAQRLTRATTGTQHKEADPWEQLENISLLK